MAQDSTLVQRGLVLVAAIAIIVGFVWLVWWRRPVQDLPRAQTRAEVLVPLLCMPASGYPGSVSWPALYQVSDGLPSTPGWEIRYNAAIALARHGSSKVPWQTLIEMLDEQRQMHNFRVPYKELQVVADEAAARRVLLTALSAVGEWLKKRDSKDPLPADLPRIRAAVTRLDQSPILELRTQAEKTLALFPHM